MSIIPKIIHTPVCLKQPIWLNYDNYPRFSQHLAVIYPPLSPKLAPITRTLAQQIQLNFKSLIPPVQKLARLVL